ncbi:hypothetical protein AXX17_AT1G65830 [Arabidopsis thaliana]|uniref:Uncharacterized protein n=1 Tax=Arabidopsis thaliana TaxID=3702 RepID=A0A178W4Y5_ARATH|nr:hypothetical protein AXX17_AT1G65830 [Arabidopsis thaliana]
MSLSKFIFGLPKRGKKIEASTLRRRKFGREEIRSGSPVRVRLMDKVFGSVWCGVVWSVVRDPTKYTDHGRSLRRRFGLYWVHPLLTRLGSMCCCTQPICFIASISHLKSKSVKSTN